MPGTSSTTKPAAVRLSARGQEKVAALAERHKISRSEAMRLALAYAFEFEPSGQLDRFVTRQVALAKSTKQGDRSGDDDG